MTEGLSLFPARCEKCGSEDVRTFWHQGPYMAAGRKVCGYGDLGKAKGEHLHYHCQNCHFDWTGPLTPPEPRKWDVRLVGAAAHPCVYDSDNQPPECPLEWPGEPWKWCGSCLARAVTAE